MDVMPTQYIDEEIYYLPEDEPFNINFEAAGMNSVFFIANIGSV